MLNETGDFNDIYLHELHQFFARKPLFLILWGATFPPPTPSPIVPQYVRLCVCMHSLLSLVNTSGGIKNM